MRGNDDAVRCSRTDGPDRNGEALRGLDHFSNADDPWLESRHGKPGHLDQLVRRLKDIEDGGETQIEDAVESEDVDTHGKDDTKNGVLANTPLRRSPLRLIGVGLFTQRRQ